MRFGPRKTISIPARRRRYKLPSGFRVAYLGAEVDFDSAYGRFTQRYQMEGEQLMVITELAMPRARIATEEIPRFNRFVDHVRDNAQITFDVDQD